MWTPLLLRLSRRALTPASRTLLIGAASLFLWMFLAASALEQQAEAQEVAPHVREHAFRFAADWRHGMAGNSPLYMPGFFALAIATWVWAGSRASRRLLFEGALVLAVSLAMASAAAGRGGETVVRAFVASTGVALAADGSGSHLPALPALAAVLAGLYTAIAWMSFVCGCRFALHRRSWRPLMPAAVLAIALMFVRTWTVDDFTSLWTERASAGNPVAIGSLVAIPALACLLAWPEVRGRGGSSNPPR